MKLRFPNDVREAGSMGDALSVQGTKVCRKRDWRDAVAASHGLMPDYVARTVAEATAAPRNWKEELARFIHASRKSDTKTWSRLSRRVPRIAGMGKGTAGARCYLCGHQQQHHGRPAERLHGRVPIHPSDLRCSSRRDFSGRRCARDLAARGSAAHHFIRWWWNELRAGVEGI